MSVKLTNQATGVAVDRLSDGEGRYLFDFVDPGIYAYANDYAPGR